MRRLAVSLLALLLVACASNPLDAGPLAVTGGTAAPAVSFTGLDDDQPRQLSAYQGKLVLLECFAYWCPHCQEDLPQVQAFVDSHPKLTLLAVESDRGAKSYVVDFKQRYGIKAEMGYDTSGELARLLEIKSFPTNILIGTDGTVLDRSVGDPPLARYERYLASIP
jgi:thiol-disulfide isomerase/thioredoxin